MKSFASVVVTYLPSQEDMRNLNNIASASDLLIIVDNSDSFSFLNFDSLNKIHIIKNECNIGLAAALNQGIEYAGQNGFSNIFLFDQDTIVESSFFKKMLDFRSFHCDSQCAFCVPNFFDRNSKTRAKFPVLNRFWFHHLQCPISPPYKTGRVLISITSGTLMSYRSFLAIGPLRDDYFIDFIDNEYCLRAADKGFYAAVNCDATINHSIGCRSVKRFLGITIKPNNHNPKRRYYIARNGTKTALNYSKKFYSYSILIMLRFIHEILSIFLYEHKKACKLKAFLIGIIDGFYNRMGKTNRKFDQQ